MSTSDPEEIRADIERTRHELSRDVDELGDKVHPGHAARRQADRVRSGMAHVKDRVMGTPHDTTGTAQEAAHDMADRGRGAAASAADSARRTASSVADTVGSAPRVVREQAQGNPLAVGLVAFGVGLVVAALLPSSRTEQRAATAVQEKAAPLVDDVKSAASEIAHDLEQPAKEGAEAVRDAAKSAAQTVAEHSREAAADVRSRTTG
ncbi:DUF3618 domain-containing protein [Promicromonospora sp. NPDC090134]|uniref:DUF3618 domain-containing protein n=1 Tax=Promicromonospora sp. NPDC090134 TaxID=3364408 RepID=UPI003803F035